MTLMGQVTDVFPVLLVLRGPASGNSVLKDIFLFREENETFPKRHGGEDDQDTPSYENGDRHNKMNGPESGNIEQVTKSTCCVNPTDWRKKRDYRKFP